MMHSRFATARATALIAAAAMILSPIAVLACGFHSSFIAKNVTPREWWEYHKHEYVEEARPPSQQVSGTREIEPEVFRENRGGVSREKQGRQRALIAMVLNHLVFLNATNVNPEEFPDFNKASIPEYNRNFKDILVELGAEAVPFILEAYLDTLRTQTEDAMGLKRNAEFQADMVDVLTKIGRASVASIAETASRTPGKREREALVSLIARILQADAGLKAVPQILKIALERWQESGPRLLAIAEDASLGGAERAIVMNVWLGVSLDKAGSSEIFAFIRNQSKQEELRCQAVGFLADRGFAPAVDELLSIAVNPAEGLYIRRECLTGIWRIKLVTPDAAVSQVTRASGIKGLITDQDAPKVLRVLSIFLLAHLRDQALLDVLLLLLHREGEDEGVLMAALEGFNVLGLQARASERIQQDLLERRGHIAAFRFGLLGLAMSCSDKRLAPVLARIVLAADEYPPMRLKAFMALHSLQMPGFGKAEEIIIGKTGFIASLSDFVFDASVSFNERAGVLSDLENLSAMQVRGPVSALFSSDRAEEAMRKGGLSDDILGPMLDLFLRYKGAGATPFVSAALGDPGANRLVLLKSAAWAGRWMVTELAEPLKAAFARSKDPSFRLAAVVALAGMGEKQSAADVAALVFPKSGPGPDPDTFAAGLELLGKIGDREALGHVIRCVKPAHEGEFTRTVEALKVLGRRGPDARPWFGHVWTAFRRSELGNAEASAAFLDCMLRMGPSQAICDNLLKQMLLEMQRLPFAQAGIQPGPGDENLEQSRRILPPLHAMSLMNSYMTRSADLFDVGNANSVQSQIWAWFRNVRKDLPKE